MDNEAKAIQAFLHGNREKLSGLGNYKIIGNRLVWRTLVTHDYANLDNDKIPAFIKAVESKQVVLIKPALNAIKQAFDKGESIRIYYKAVEQDVIATKLKQPDGSMLTLGNSSVLSLIGRTVSFGRTRSNRSETTIQSALSKLIPMLPFNVFKEAKLRLDTIEIVDKGAAETIMRQTPENLRKYKKNKDGSNGDCINPTETLHFTGASLFKVDGSYFLFDIDRREIEHAIFNPFLVKLPCAVRTIAEAYAVLKPEEVKAAEESGTIVMRQGEWFFLPVSELEVRRLNTLAKYKKRITLRAGRNRPNWAEGIQLVNGIPVDANGYVSGTETRVPREDLAESVCYVTGAVQHSGREHADLLLPGWYKAVPNTAQDSFTITGDVD